MKKLIMMKLNEMTMEELQIVYEFVKGLHAGSGSREEAIKQK